MSHCSCHLPLTAYEELTGLFVIRNSCPLAHCRHHCENKTRSFHGARLVGPPPLWAGRVCDSSTMTDTPCLTRANTPSEPVRTYTTLIPDRHCYHYGCPRLQIQSPCPCCGRNLTRTLKGAGFPTLRVRIPRWGLPHSVAVHNEIRGLELGQGMWRGLRSL